MSRWERESEERYEREVADGKHDEQCERGPRLMTYPSDYTGEVFLHMCHCAKRRRIASGLTEPSGPLEHRMPDCTHCGREVDHDGDSFRCERCHLSWNPRHHEDPGTFTDDYGNLGIPITKEQP